MQENRLRAASAKYVSVACCCTTLHTRRFIRTRISPHWSSWSCRVTITPLIAIVSAVYCASTRTVKTTVIALIKPTAMCANVPRVMPKMIALLISTNALTINAKMVQLASMVSPITLVCVRTAGRDGCEYSFLFKFLNLTLNFRFLCTKKN